MAQSSGILFLLFASVILPITLAIIWIKRWNNSKPVFLGAATFLIFQVLTRLPLLQVVLPRFAWFHIFAATQPVLYLFLLSFSAGIFEEIGRSIVMRKFMKDSPFSWSIGFGIGHGGIEAVLLIGTGVIIQLFQAGGAISGTPPSMLFLGGLERLFAISAHIGLSVMVWESIKSRRSVLLLLAILLHGLFNFSAVYLLQQGFSLYVVEGLLGLFAAGFLIYVVLRWQTNARGNNHASEKR